MQSSILSNKFAPLFCQVVISHSGKYKKPLTEVEVDQAEGELMQQKSNLQKSQNSSCGALNMNTNRIRSLLEPTRNSYTIWPFLQTKEASHF